MADRTLHSSIPHFSLHRQFIVKAFSDLSVIFPMKLPSTAGNFHKKCLYGYCVIRALWVLYRQTHAPASHDENGKRKPSRPCTRRNTILNLSVQQKDRAVPKIRNVLNYRPPCHDARIQPGLQSFQNISPLPQKACRETPAFLTCFFQNEALLLAVLPSQGKKKVS